MEHTRHTRLDYEALIAAGVDPDSTQPRERPVTCTHCWQRTWNQAARCDEHYIAPNAARWAVTS